VTVAVEPALVDFDTYAGYLFTNWSTGATTPAIAVTPTADLTLTATYRLACYALGADPSPAIGGSITVSPALPAVQTIASNCYPPGSMVTLTAVPTAAYQFAGWTGSETSANPMIAVTMDAAKFLVARFVLR
jgi:hypothetical protein